MTEDKETAEHDAPEAPEVVVEEEEKPGKPTAAGSKFDAKYLTALAALVASIAGLGNSWAAYQKAKQEQVARDSYKTVTLAVERLSDEVKMNHDEVVMLRQYLAEHIAANAIALQQPPPDPPPEIDSRPAPVQVVGGRRTGTAPTVAVGLGGPVAMSAAPTLAASAGASPSSAAPVPTAGKSAKWDKTSAKARPPAQMPAEWPEP